VNRRLSHTSWLYTVSTLDEHGGGTQRDNSVVHEGIGMNEPLYQRPPERGLLQRSLGTRVSVNKPIRNRNMDTVTLIYLSNRVLFVLSTSVEGL